MLPSLLPSIEFTADKSHTLRDRINGQTYHSLHGACAESQHVFIHSGLLYMRSYGVTSFSIFEVGFGTGLNALLAFITSLEDPGMTIQYRAIEKNPLPEEIYSSLNYPKILNQHGMEEAFLHMHTGKPQQEICLADRFTLNKYNLDVLHYTGDIKHNLVFHDAFSPNIQPELWSSAFFAKTADMMMPDGVLVTYSAAGQVRRNLKDAGFEVEKIPGPPGKREMTRAIKR
ncbi:MAG: tRNA (5-methylaminomethyl-2-thiouridine)(34)-methyltransferase MnmD [Bacteroidota bacterium]